MTTKTVHEYTALTAGSNTITEKGKTLVFAGPKGGHGTYMTSDPDEIKHLDQLHDSPTAQVSRTAIKEVDTETGEAVAVTVTAEAPVEDPAVQKAAADAAASAERATDPAVKNAQEKLAATIAANKAAA